MQVNLYNNALSANRADSKNGAINNKQNAGDLNMQDFLNLLTNQLANQDMMKPMDDTQFISQMAQFTSLQAMQTISELTYAQYGASMIGKNVLVAEYDKKGNYVEVKGVVEAVKFAGGHCTITVNGKEYAMSAIMEVLNKIDKPETGEGEGEGGDTKPDKPEKPETV